MNKGIGILIAIMSFSVLSVLAQKVPGRIEQAAKDPKRAENAAKADVYILDKRRISDKEVQNTQAATAPSRKKKQKKSPKG